MLRDLKMMENFEKSVIFGSFYVVLSHFAFKSASERGYYSIKNKTNPTDLTKI